MTFEKTARELIQNAYGDGVKITNIKVQQGSEPGENYGSIMSALTVTIEKKNRQQSTLHLMAKRLPTSGFIRDAFNVEVTFPKEKEFYEIVLPEYSKLLKANNIQIDYENSFPKFIGAKLAGEDFILVMENIKIHGYRLGKISQGLNMAESTLVMREIALLHALGIAAKLKKPEIYESKIKRTGRSLKEGQDVATVKEEIYTFFDQIIDYLKGLEEIKELVPRLQKTMKENFLYADMVEGYTPREPFSTLVHNDLWLNNIMFKYDENDEPMSVKLLDFQRCKVGSIISDLILFLYVSTSLDVMINKFDVLLRLYHDHLTASLTQLGVSAEDFAWDKFQLELKYATEEVSMPVSMLRFLFKNGDFDSSQLDMEKLGSFNDSSECRTRHIQVLRDMARRGWI